MRTEFALKYVSEFVRILKPGGAALFQAPSRCLLKGRTSGIAEVPLGDETARIEMHAHPRDRIKETVIQAGGRIVECLPDRSAGENFESLCFLVSRTANARRRAADGERP